MTRKLILSFLGLTMMGAGPSLFGAGDTNRQEKQSNTERVNFAPGGTIHINNSFGSLIVEGWDQPQVEITVEKSMPYNYDAKQASQHLERVSVKTEHPSPTELTVSTSLPGGRHFPLFSSPSGSVMLDYQVRVPRDSKLVIHHGVGYVMVSNVSGEIEATCHRGDIMLMLPSPGPYAIDAKSKLGNVLSDFSGDAHVQHLVGEKFASEKPAPARRIYLRMGFGGITIKELPLRP